MSEGRILCTKADGVASILIDRTEARNAMTWSMYAALASHLEDIAADPDVRVAVLRGAGGAFVSGTDIQQFTAFEGEEDGLKYEHRIDAAIEQIEVLKKPTLAVIEGWCTGGGLAIASACDIRIAAKNARFGVPIARTLGNCLSVANVARLLAHFGPGRVKRLLLLADFIAAEEAWACGYVETVAEPAELDAKAAAICDRLKGHAPLTMAAAKEAIRRVVLRSMPDGEDLIRACYGSADFKEGVAAFLAKRKPRWTGE